MLGNLGGQPYVNIFHAFLPANSISSNAQLATWATAWHSALNSSGLLAHFSDTLHVTLLEHVLFINNVLVYRASGAVTESGTAPGTVLPASAAAVLSWNTGAYYRGGKPRTYMGGVPASSVDTNHSFLDAAKANIQSSANALVTNINAIVTAQVPDTTFCFINWQRKNVWNNPPLTYEITGCVVHDRLGSQRRRLGPWLP